jgi:adenylylsulfate kinase
MSLTIWLTGLSSSGKSTIAVAVCEELRASGYRVEWLDGDVARQQLCRGLGFGKDDRDENVRRIAYVAALLTRNGIVTVVSAISPYGVARAEARRRVGSFLEVYVNAPIEVCERRDLKGIYRRARAGETFGVTGIDDPYEPPERPDVECRTDIETLEESVASVLAAFREAIRPASESRAGRLSTMSAILT